MRTGQVLRGVRPSARSDGRGPRHARAGAGGRAGSARAQGDLEALPFARGSLGGAWARNSYVHVARNAMPMALARLHDAMAVDAPLYLTMIGGGDREGAYPNDDFPGRFFALWSADALRSVVEG